MGKYCQMFFNLITKKLNFFNINFLSIKNVLFADKFCRRNRTVRLFSLVLKIQKKMLKKKVVEDIVLWHFFPYFCNVSTDYMVEFRKEYNY